MSRSKKKGTGSSEVTRPTASTSVSRSPSSTQAHEVTSGRVDAPVGKWQYITNSEPEHEITDHRIDAPAGKWQYITDSASEIEITDKGTCGISYTLVVKDLGRKSADVKKLLGVSARSNVNPADRERDRDHPARCSQV